MANKTLLYRSAMAGMPGAATTAGGLVAILNACLVDGLNPTTATGVTRSGSTATYALSGTVNFAIGEIVESSGWDQPEYNGRFKVTAKTAGSVSVTVSGTPATPGTGTSMSMKHPGAGWTKSVFATNVVGYTAGAGSQGLNFQVEDNNPYNDANVSARTRMAQGLTGLDTAVAVGEQRRVQKAGGGWVLVADARTCYLVMNSTHVLHFGEFASFLAGDAFPWFQTRGETGETNSTQSRVGISGRYFPQWLHNPNMAPTYGTPGISLLRGAAQTGGPVDGHSLDLFDTAWQTGNANSQRWQPLPLPSAVDGSVPLLPMHLAEYGSAYYAVRGVFRGMYWPVGRHAAGSFVSSVLRLDDVTINGELREVAVLRFGLNAESQIAFDLGDWA